MESSVIGTLVGMWRFGSSGTFRGSRGSLHERHNFFLGITVGWIDVIRLVES